MREEMSRRMTQRSSVLILTTILLADIPQLSLGNGNASKSCRAMDFLSDFKDKYGHQPTFLQAVDEMALSLQDLFDDGEDGEFYQRAFLVMAEPERTISFRVAWTDDKGNLEINRGWRVEFNSALGPYKGGLRFHPSVNEGILKFLGFEQIFKNALTGLPLGGGKGGSDFDPKGKSEAEVRRFCESFMTELHRYIGASTDVPAGDIGVGGREIGFLYGQYKRLTNIHGVGVLTGKGIDFGGSHLRPEATGYGLVYMTKHIVENKLEKKLDGMRCAISGSGNVAQFAARKLLEFDAKVITLSDSNGVLVFEEGMTSDELDMVFDCKNNKRGRLSDLKGKVSGEYHHKKSPWELDTKFDLALPCATQNEIDKEGVQQLVKNGILALLEGANLPVEAEAQQLLRASEVIYIPGKASNAGGVGVSGLEMSQNAQRLQWTPDEVDHKLKEMMKTIWDGMKEEEGNGATLEQGANRAGFVKVANAMKDLGWVW